MTHSSAAPAPHDDAVRRPVEYATRRRRSIAIVIIASVTLFGTQHQRAVPENLRVRSRGHAVAAC